MIQVTVGNTLNRHKVVVDENTTLKQVLEDNEINYGSGQMTLDGATVPAGGLDKTFAEWGIKEKCLLLSVVKADNA